MVEGGNREKRGPGVPSEGSGEEPGAQDPSDSQIKCESRVTANCLHPGVVKSNFGSSGSLPFHLMFSAIKPFMISPERGARTSIYLASSKEVEGVTGNYFARCKPRRTSRFARDPDNAERLWEESERLTGL